MADYTRWYTNGTASVTNGSKTVTGTDTFWLAAGLHAGDMFSIDSVKEYEIDTVNSNTQLTLKTNYGGATSSGITYRIIRNFTATTGAQIAAQAAELLTDFRKYIDTDMQSIHGKSAYELAKDGGFTGTQAEWLESLIGAGKWNELSELTSVLGGTGEFFKNQGFWRGKNLGTEITDDQWAAISSGKFTDMWLGDYWVIDKRTFRITHFNYHQGLLSSFGGASKGNHLVLVPDTRLVGCDQGDDNLAKGQHYFTSDKETWTSYEASNWYQNLKPIVEEYLAGLFGEDHLLKFSIPKMLIKEGGTSSYDYNHLMDQRCAIPNILQALGWDECPRYRAGIQVQRGRFAGWLHNIPGNRMTLRDVFSRPMMSSSTTTLVCPMLCCDGHRCHHFGESGAEGGFEAFSSIRPYFLIG